MGGGGGGREGRRERGGIWARDMWEILGHPALSTKPHLEAHCHRCDSFDCHLFKLTTTTNLTTSTYKYKLHPTVINLGFQIFHVFIMYACLLKTLISGYVRTHSYSIGKMEQREKEIRTKAEQIVTSSLSVHRRVIFNWILYHARRGVKHRENMRFARTKLWGVFRDLFRYDLVL